MYNDVEADFWKEIFVHIQHKNMVKTNGEIIHASDAPALFAEFDCKHKDFPSEITNTSTYFTWEIFVTETIKLRLFIQTQIKATLLQKYNDDLVKIADAKFPYNPLPEIEEFLNNKDIYEKELKERLANYVRFQKQQKITGEIIKALLKRKFENTDIVWSLEFTTTDYVLSIHQKGEIKNYPISFKDFKQNITDLRLL